jgi:hypothetical protein
MPDANDQPQVPTLVPDQAGESARAELARLSDQVRTTMNDQARPARTGKRVPEMHVHNIGDQVRAWAEKAIIRTAHGERYGWDASLVMIPQPAPTGFTIMSSYVIIVYAPNALINQPALGAVRVIGDNPTEDQVSTAISSAVEELRQERSKGLIMRPPVRQFGRPVKDNPQA